MTKIHFHQLQGAAEETLIRALQLACQLADEAGKKNQSVLVYCPDKTRLNTLDDLLWAHIPTSFIAHSRDPKDRAPVYICTDDEPGDYHDMMINLDSDTPAWFSRFSHLAELIYGSEAYIQSKRERYAYYKQRGYPLRFIPGA